MPPSLAFHFNWHPLFLPGFAAIRILTLNPWVRNPSHERAWVPCPTTLHETTRETQFPQDSCHPPHPCQVPILCMAPKGVPCGHSYITRANIPKNRATRIPEPKIKTKKMAGRTGFLLSAPHSPEGVRGPNLLLSSANQTETE